MSQENNNSIMKKLDIMESNEELILIEIRQIKEQLDLQNRMLTKLLKRTEHLVRYR